MKFTDRLAAGQLLAEKLSKYQDYSAALVLGLPRGGVVLAAVIADKLKLGLDIIVPRKIGAPGNPEFAIGAVTLDGPAFFNETVVGDYGISQDYINRLVEKEKAEARRRLEKYRQDKPPLLLKNKIAILVDDGVATGATMKASILSVRQQNPQKIVVAVPVIAKDSINEIKNMADELIYLFSPDFFEAVGNFYDVFEQTSDEEVIDLLKNPR